LLHAQASPYTVAAVLVEVVFGTRQFCFYDIFKKDRSLTYTHMIFDLQQGASDNDDDDDDYFCGGGGGLVGYLCVVRFAKDDSFCCYYYYARHYCESKMMMQSCHSNVLLVL